MHWFVLLLALHFAVSKSLAQRPLLVTEEPLTFGDGNQFVGVGMEYLRKSSTDEGIRYSRLLKVPVLQVEVGLGERVNLQLHWRGGLFAQSNLGTSASDFGDLFVATKILIRKEANGLPALGFKYAVKLPITGDENRLGSDITDFFGSLLFSKKIGIVTSRLNVGVGILGHPRAQNAQDDIYTYGTAILLPISHSVVSFAETTGFFGPFEDDDKLVGRLGVEVRGFDLAWAIFGSVKLFGTPRDFSTAFELSEVWGIGVFVSKHMQL